MGRICQTGKAACPPERKEVVLIKLLGIYIAVILFMAILVTGCKKDIPEPVKVNGKPALMTGGETPPVVPPRI